MLGGTCCFQRGWSLMSLRDRKNPGVSWSGEEEGTTWEPRWEGQAATVPGSGGHRRKPLGRCELESEAPIYGF